MNKSVENEADTRYLRALAKSYPTINSAAHEIIRLNAMLTLPMGTEHFITDLHGEFDQYLHVTRNGSGAIRRKIDDEYGADGREEEKRALAALIYYPRHKLYEVKQTVKDMPEWYRTTLYHLIRICRQASTKYTRSKVSKAIPPESHGLIEELLSYRLGEANQEDYYNKTIESVIATGQADELVVTLSRLIRRLIVDHIHVIGDIFDRGANPHKIMDSLMKHPSIDIQWGNHDIEWMGAAAGCEALIANVIRNSVRYGNLSTLEDGYGINLVPLARFAMETYRDIPCKGVFRLHYDESDTDVPDLELDEKIHRAITILQFKLEGQLIRRNPDCRMEDRLLLSHIDPSSGTVQIDGKTYPMKDMGFPTIDWSDPYRLTDAEADVIYRLKNSFMNCEKLQRHVRFLYEKGSLYKVHNGNLLYHGCIPLNDDGSLRDVSVYGECYSGKKLMDALDTLARKGYYSIDPVEKQRGLDTMFFLWEHSDSPVFGKRKMSTFERYFVDDKDVQVENKDAYYSFLENEEVINRILEDFGLSDTTDAHIVNGHVPVEAKAGESPIKCGGKLLIIDGGFSKAYHDKTGIAGYTLIYHSYGMLLAAHEPFESIEKAVREGSDIHSHLEIVQKMSRRRTIADTDIGRRYQSDVADLEKLLDAYRSGEIKEGREV